MAKTYKTSILSVYDENGNKTAIPAIRGEKGENGEKGVGIESVQQTVTSSDSYGQNVTIVTLTNGTTAPIIVRNGKDGSTPVRGVDYFTEEDKAEMISTILNAIPSAEGVGF